MKDPTDILLNRIVFIITGLFALCMVVWVIWEVLRYLI